MQAIELRSLGKTYQVAGRDFAALQEAHANIAVGSFSVIIGRSGCGKTTLLRLLAGMEKATTGNIAFPSEICRIGMVFQEPRLMPWLNVQENMAFAIRETQSREKVREVVDYHIGVLGLERFRTAYPSQLSGGMAQRVSLGRTLCYEPDLVLMDEPFGALDYFTRRQLQREIVDLFLEEKKTIVLVTHDVNEAVLLGQNILIMDSGRIIRELPVDLPYHRKPATAEFMTVQQNVLNIFGVGKEGEKKNG